MEDKDYKCRNGAYHDTMCCPTCWNGHPEAVKDVMFMGSVRWKELVEKNFIDSARAVAFSYEQAWFLYKYCR